jgi:hypothetical protein
MPGLILEVWYGLENFNLLKLGIVSEYNEDAIVSATNEFVYQSWWSDALFDDL